MFQGAPLSVYIYIYELHFEFLKGGYIRDVIGAY